MVGRKTGSSLHGRWVVSASPGHLDSKIMTDALQVSHRKSKTCRMGWKKSSMIL
jgi:hypothetical protein